MEIIIALYDFAYRYATDMLSLRIGRLRVRYIFVSTPSTVVSSMKVISLSYYYVIQFVFNSKRVNVLCLVWAKRTTENMDGY